MQGQKVTQALKLLEEAQKLLNNQGNQNIQKSRALLEESINFLREEPKEHN